MRTSGTVDTLRVTRLRLEGADGTVGTSLRTIAGSEGTRHTCTTDGQAREVTLRTDSTVQATTLTLLTLTGA